MQFPTRRELIYAGYIQDKWQVSPKLTVDLGLRLERENASTPRFAGSYSNYNPFTNALELNGIGGRPFNNGIRSDLGWGPRAGIAYRVDEKTVIRTGFGISFINRIMGQQNFPVKQNNSFVAPNAFTASGAMAEGFPAFQQFTVPDNGIIDLNLPENALFSRQNFGWVNPDLQRPYVPELELRHPADAADELHAGPCLCRQPRGEQPERLGVQRGASARHGQRHAAPQRALGTHPEHGYPDRHSHLLQRAPDEA